MHLCDGELRFASRTLMSDPPGPQTQIWVATNRCLQLGRASIRLADGSSSRLRNPIMLSQYHRGRLPHRLSATAAKQLMWVAANLPGLCRSAITLSNIESHVPLGDSKNRHHERDIHQVISAVSAARCAGSDRAGGNTSGHRPDGKRGTSATVSRGYPASQE
jgi:hypothetical protein